MNTKNEKIGLEFSEKTSSARMSTYDTLGNENGEDDVDLVRFRQLLLEKERAREEASKKASDEYLQQAFSNELSKIRRLVSLPFFALRKH